MDNIYSPIEQKTDFPVKIEMLPWGNVQQHWHDGVEIILVLSGNVSIVIDDMVYAAAEDDIVLVNCNLLHEIKSKNGVYISVFINLAGLTADMLSASAISYFDCNSVIDFRKERFDILRSLIAGLMKENLTSNGNETYLYKSYAYELLDALTSKFASAGAPKTKKYLQRLNSITQYVNKHYMEQLTLIQIAEIEHLSVPYLSSFFEKHMGITFQQFYTQIRLDKALKDILFTDLSIEEIARNNGFGDPRSFVSFFKKKYDMLPSQYRKLHTREMKPQDKAATQVSADADYRKFKREDYTEKLLRYLKPKSAPQSMLLETTKYVSANNIDMLHGVKTLSHNFKKFISVGRAKELLMTDVQQMLRHVQTQVGYEYIRFHGILSDDMCVYHEDEDGNVQLSFVLVDKAIDFLLSINLKPMIQLCFMPKDLAEDPQKTIFYSQFCISPPKSMEKWVFLVEQLIIHLQNRYGSKIIEQWLYCIWSGVNDPLSPLKFKADNSFFELYKCSYHAVKRINPKLVFGTPSLILISDISKNWLTDFTAYFKENDCVPQFINIMFYNDDFMPVSFLDQKNQSTHFLLNNDPDSFRKYIDQVKALVKALDIDNIPVYLTEWNLTISHRNLLNDTCFKSCYIVKNLLENYDELDGFGYWLLTDMVEETQPNPRLFHGGLGLFTYNGLPKPHYFAFYLLNKLGDILIKRGDGYFITKSYGAIQIFLYNYQHFNYHLASGEIYDSMFTERYAPFSNLGKMEILLNLENLVSKKCLIREYIVNQNHGSSFDLWVNIGGVEIEIPSDMELFKQGIVPKFTLREVNIQDGELVIDAYLAPLEIRLIEIMLS